MPRPANAALALIVVVVASTGAAQPRTRRVRLDSERLGSSRTYCLAGSRWTLCGGDRGLGEDEGQLGLHYALRGTRTDLRVPPRQAWRLERWLARTHDAPREAWDRRVATRYGGYQRVDVSADRRHAHVRVSRCGSPGCDCSTDTDIDVRYDARGRLLRYARITTTCECADSTMSEDVLTYDDEGALTAVRRTRYWHPFCQSDDPTEAERFSHDTLTLEDGSMPRPHDTLECTFGDGRQTLTCASDDHRGFTFDYAPE